jgi:uncharacterized protein YjeT (DUF2065 family)
MKSWLLSSFGLMLILEGIMPLFFPEGWRNTFKKMISMRGGQIRFMGLISSSLGLIFLFLGS